MGDGDEKATIGSTLLSAIVPATVTALGGIVVTWYTLSSQAHDQNIEGARAAASALAQADQQEQAVRQQNRSAQIDLLRDLAPRVVGSAGSSSNCRLVLDLWESAYPGSPAPVLRNACSAYAVSEGAAVPQHWGVAIGNPSPEADACKRSGLAGSKGFAVAPVYRIRHLEFQTIVGDYSSKSDAEPIAAAVRMTLRLEARVMPFDSNIPPYYKFHVCREFEGDAGETDSDPDEAGR